MALFRKVSCISLGLMLSLVPPALAEVPQVTPHESGPTTVITVRCPTGNLLPGVAEMTTDYPQRIAPPSGGEDASGVYGSLTNGQRVALHLNPNVYKGMSAMSGALLREGSLEAGHREMIIVRVGYVENSIYEVVQHASLAGSVGVPTAKIDALACEKPQGLDPAERALMIFVDEQLATSRASDEALAGMRAHFSESQIVEAILVIGNWWMISRLMETSGAQLEDRRIGTGGVAE